GLPLPDLAFHVVDDTLTPQPPGTPGELLVTGPGVSHGGYLGSGRLNRARFVTGPRGERAYRTGDIVVQTPEGEFEYRGRNDDQVKIRGYRVELGEVESALRALDDVAGGAVVARDLPEVGRTLVAYVVPRGGEEVDAVSLRRRLARTLPDYMVPGAVVPVDRLPLTQNGKLDRNALPDPRPASDAPARSPESRPQDATEERVARMVADLLGVDSVDPVTDFFELGGHSLLATRLVGRVQSEFGVDVPLRVFLREPTVRALTATVRGADAGGTRSGGLRLLRAPDGVPVPATDPQRRMHYLAQLDPGSGAYLLHQALLLRGPLDVTALERAFGTVVDRHAPLRTVFQLTDDGLVQRVRPAGAFRLQVDPAGAAPGDVLTEVGRLSEAELRRPFDLERDDLLRVRLSPVAPDVHALLVTMHHAVSDGWSISVLAEEVRAAYARLRTHPQEPVPAAEPEVTFADYAYSMARWAAGPDAEQDLAYWQERLAGVPVVHSLPLDHPRPPEATGAGGTLERTVDAALAEAVRRLAVSRGATPFMVLLAAFAVLLARRSGRDDVVVGIPVANRGTPELESLIGMFVNSLVLRTRVDRDATFQDLLTQVRDQTLQDLDHQHVPLDLLVERLNPPRSTAHAPLFQIMFAYQNTEVPAIELDGVEATLVRQPEQDALAELMLDVFEIGGGLSLRWHHSTDLFDPSSVGSLADEYVALLRRVAADPALPVGELLGARPAPAQRPPVLRLRSGAAPVVAALPGVLGLDTSFAQVAGHIDRTVHAVATRHVHAALGRSDGTVVPLARACADAVVAAASAEGAGSRVHLVGHSYGGALAVHLAHRLRERGVDVAGIVVLDAATPEALRRTRGTSRREHLRAFLEILAHTFPSLAAHAGPGAVAEIAATPEPEVLARVQEMVGTEAGELLQGGVAEVFESYLALSALDWPPVPVPEDVPVLLVEAAREARLPEDLPRTGWRALVGERLAVTTVDADHEGLMRGEAAVQAGRLVSRFVAEHERGADRAGRPAGTGPAATGTRA
ncbi:MAG: alpha/beta fold hydrolase, partial [Actinomycetales bacterium]